LAQRFEQNTWSDLTGINILEQSLAYTPSYGNIFNPGPVDPIKG